MGYDQRRLLADLNVAPFRLSGLVRDLVWATYGAAHTWFEPEIMMHKVRGLSGRNRVYPHN